MKIQHTQIIQLISGLLNINEKYFLNSHSQSMTAIVRAVAEEMALDSETITSLIYASLLHGITTTGMSDSFLINDPFDLDAKQLEQYFDYFNQGISLLRKIPQLNKITGIIDQMWEHEDGTGKPGGLVGLQIQKTSQILSIANLFHNKIYRLSPDQLNQMRSTGEVVQTPEQTKNRHAEAIKFLYRRATWFEMDVFNVFQEMVKKRKHPIVLPDQNTLTLSFGSKPISVQKTIDESYDPNSDGSAEQSFDITKKNRKPVDRETPVAELEEGMKVARTIVTKAGHTIARESTILDSNLINQIQQLEKSGMIPETVLIEFPPGL